MPETFTIFTLLAADNFASVLDALALIRFRTTVLANFSSSLADLLLVDTLDGNLQRIDSLEFNAFRSLEDHRMREAENQVEVLALLFYAVANANDFESLLETLGHAFDHVVDESASGAVHSAGELFIVRAGEGELVAIEIDGDELVDVRLELAEGAFHLDVLTIDVNFDASGDSDYSFSNTRHLYLTRP